MTQEQQLTTPPEPEMVGLLAEFGSPDELVRAAKTIHSAGYKEIDAFTPFPIHEMDGALGVRPTKLPWLVLAAGLIGGVVALGFQWWTNAVDYPMLISGKPLFSLPANIPVTFEVIILAAAGTAFFGMLALNGLPKFSNPKLQCSRFVNVTTDGFFLAVDSTDELFDSGATTDALQRAGALHIETVFGSTGTQQIPKAIWMTIAVVGSLALLPPVFIASARSTTSELPRLHNFFNMDFQPKYKSQTTTSLFEDKRSMRPRIVGTVPRGSLKENPEFEFGYVPTSEGGTSEQLPIAERQFVQEIPMPITPELMDRGHERYDIHCAVCHGKAGYGNGLVSQRALELQQGTWVPPTSIHSPHLLDQPAGQLFNSITNGVRKMPAYGHQIPVEDRWAIVLYLRALQRSQQAALSDVPEDLRTTLREMN